MAIFHTIKLINTVFHEITPIIQVTGKLPLKLANSVTMKKGASAKQQ